MNQRRQILRTLLFCIFFGVGAAALATGILTDELQRYYQARQLRSDATETLQILRSLNEDYDALIARLQDDPNMLRRLAPAGLADTAEPNTVNPRFTPEQLAAAKEALAEQNAQTPTPHTIPDWLERCSEPRKRLLLLVSGAALLIISFAFFGSPRPQTAKLSDRSHRPDREQNEEA
jgi:hypothetical protein